MTIVRFDLRKDFGLPAVGRVWLSTVTRVHIDNPTDWITVGTPIPYPLVEGKVQIEMRPTDDTFCWCVREDIPEGATRFITVPNSVSPVDYGDLPDVNPVSYLPVDPTPTLIETIDARIAANPVPEDQIENAVEEYLAANPVTTGQVWPQTIPLSSWTIPHTLGRVPSVTLYVDGVQVDADVYADSTTVSVVYPSPTSGVAVLT